MISKSRLFLFFALILSIALLYLIENDGNQQTHLHLDSQKIRISNSNSAGSVLADVKVEKPVRQSIRRETLTLDRCLEMGASKNILTEQCHRLIAKSPLLNRMRSFSMENLRSLSDEVLLEGFLILKDNFEMPDLARLKEVVDELKERIPNHPEVAKAALMPIGLRSLSDIREHLATHFENAQTQNPSDSEILAIDMFLSLTDRESNFLENINDYSVSNPQSGMGYFYAAGAYYQNGQIDMAKKSISMAAAREPENKLYKEAELVIQNGSDYFPILTIYDGLVWVSKSELYKMLEN